MRDDSPVVSMVEKPQCPKCGNEYDASRHRLSKCPECGAIGSTACCNSQGAGRRCDDCDNYSSFRR
jgi:predicted RNA-binding Zn-ribbon protein involved in translation (DUF1610 family)